MARWLKENWFKLVIAVVALLVGLSYFNFYALRPLLNKPKIDKCLEDIKDKYNERWKSYCRLDRKEIGTDGFCLLSDERADTVYERFNDEKGDCFKKYP